MASVIASANGIHDRIVGVVTQFWIHQDFLKCYFISIIIYKNPKKLKESLKLKKKKYFARVNRIFP